MTKSAFKQPTAAQRAALIRFAERNGRNWKDRLREVWFNGRYGDEFRYGDGTHADACYLQQVRNQFGPVWLDTFSI